MLDKIVYIYLLLDEDGLPLYVGQTINLRNRIGNHRKNKPNFYCFFVLEIVEVAESNCRERFWIETFLKMGFCLENRNNGGSSPNLIGHSVSQEARIKIGNAHRGKIISDEQRRKMSASLAGKSQSPTHVANNKLSLRKSYDEKDWNSQFRGVKQAPEFVEKRIAPQRGKSKPEVSLKLKGHSVSQETRNKIQATLLRRGELRAAKRVGQGA